MSRCHTCWNLPVACTCPNDEPHVITLVELQRMYVQAYTEGARPRLVGLLYHPN